MSSPAYRESKSILFSDIFVVRLLFYVVIDLSYITLLYDFLMILFRKEYRLRKVNCQGMWQNGFSLTVSRVVVTYSLWNITCKNTYNNVINMLIQ